MGWKYTSIFSLYAVLIDVHTFIWNYVCIHIVMGNIFFYFSQVTFVFLMNTVDKKVNWLYFVLEMM